MANLGNVWHLPANPEPRGLPPRGRTGMRDPVFPTTSVGSVTITTGNQFQGGGNQGNQLQVGSSLFFKQTTDANWTPVPLIFVATVGDNKYYSADIPTATFNAGVVIQYYLQIAYDDHDRTFLQLNQDGTTSATTGNEQGARATPFTFTIETSDVRGQWGPVFTLPNVAIHAHVLPNGLVLMWGRRDSPDQSLEVDPPSPIHVGAPPAPKALCTPFLWNPATNQVTMTFPPNLGDPQQTNANLFCSAHAFLPDGRLLVAGGHLADRAGLDLTTIYDPVSGKWTPSKAMQHGRWYPTAASLQDGGVLVLSGSFRAPDGTIANNTVPERWNAGTLTELAHNPDGPFDLYPRLHVASNGPVFTTGSLQQTWSLDTSGGGVWNKVPTQRDNAQRDYAPSVMYDVDKIIYIGGGTPPTANAELLDLSQANPQWQGTAHMNFPRRQHNATILADGTVLVTGGTRSGGAGPPQDFNNLDPGQPVHVAELWDPKSKQWTQLAAEAIDRCYHSTAVLLPDARVLSAGGGEFFPLAVKEENDPFDSHADAQVFSPPYLFKGARPVISSAPDAVRYGETFRVETAQASEIADATWIRLGSVTHSFNTGQRLNHLSSKPSAGGLDVTAPGSARECPPGHYMLFLISSSGAPSVARIIQIAAPTGAQAQRVAPAQARVVSVSPPAPRQPKPLDVFAQRAAVLAAAKGTKVVVGLTGTCPYGIAACWGGANEGLMKLEGVEFVDPIPDADDSTATLFLVDDGLPRLDRWQQQFRRIVNESYVLRGVEVTLKGTVDTRGEQLFLGRAGQPDVPLAPLNPANKVQLSPATRAPQAALPDEAAAYATLATEVSGGPLKSVTVAGPLTQAGGGHTLEVRVVQH